MQPGDVTASGPPHAASAAAYGAPAGVRVSWAARAPIIATAGACAVMAWAEAPRSPAAWAAACACVLLAVSAARIANGLARALGWGLAMAVGALAPHASAALEVLGGAGVLACASAVVVAVSELPSEGALARSATSGGSRSARRVAVVVLSLVVVAWGWSLAGSVVQSHSFRLFSRAARPWWVATWTLAVLVAYVEWTLRTRPLDLGMSERALAIRAAFGAALAICVGAAALDSTSDAAPFARVAMALACTAAGAAALHRDPVRVVTLTRRLIVFAACGGAASAAGVFAFACGAGEGATAAVAAAVALALGAAAPRLAAPLRPAGGVWLDAFARAAADASRPDPDEAIREALVALRAPGGLSSPSPQLWTIAPAQVTTVDAAGYVHVRDGELPPSLVAVAASEPEATLRADLVEALRVRRPDLRALGQWLSDHGALLATLLARDGDVEGVLVLPRVAGRRSPTFEEVRALQRVAERLTAPCRARAAQARLLERARDADARTEAADDRVERMKHERALEQARNALAAASLARGATVGVYASASRIAIEALEQRAALGAPLAVVAPSGVDPVPYIARAHLAGARRDGPLVVVDATRAREHEPARWADPRFSPLALADRGLLAIIDVGALPAKIQEIVARALAERRSPWERAEPLDVQLAVTSVASPDEMAARSLLHPALAARLGDAGATPIVLPRLRDRIEDMRAIIVDRLAREGLRAVGRPVGIEPAAYARLIEYAFPGDDAELTVIAQRLAARCSGEVVRAGDVDALRLSGSIGSIPPPPSERARKPPLGSA